MNTPNSTTSKPIIITRVGLAVIAILVLGAFMRLQDLGRMAYHHDESLHAYYSYNMYSKGLHEFPYSPVYHGPFLYHTGAFFFYLFGDSDFTGRLPFAFAGILLLGLIWHARRHIGTMQALFCLSLAVLSPVLTYFSRFARNDVYMATATFALLVFTLDYLQTKKTSFFLGICSSLVILYTIKENSYVVGATFCGYLVFYGIWYVWSHPAGSRARGLYNIIVGYNPLVKLLLFYFFYSASVLLYVRILLSPHDWDTIAEHTSSKTLELSAINSTIDRWLADHTWFPWTYWGIALLLTVIAFVFLSVLRRILERRFEHAQPEGDSGSEEQSDALLAFCRRNLPFAAGMTIIFLVFVALFTKFGTVTRNSQITSNLAALYDGSIDYLSYWMAQQMHKPRIANLPWYYIPRLGLYETLPIFLSAAAYMVYAGRSWGIMEMLGFPLICWSALRLVFWKLMYKLVSSGWLSIQEPLPPPFASMLFGSALLFVCGLVLIVAGRFWPTMSRPWESREDEGLSKDTDNEFRLDGVRAFLVFWTVSSLVIYALLNEKVPWLLTHQALPMVLLGGVLMGDLWSSMREHWGRYLLLATFLFLCIPGIRANCVLNFYNNDNPQELIVYTQTHADVPRLVKQIKDIANLLGRDYQPDTKDYKTGSNKKTLVAVHDEGSWPLTWYLRRYETRQWGSHTPLPSPLPPIVIGDDTGSNKEMVARMADGEYDYRLIYFRAWWPGYGRYWNPFHRSNDPDFQGDATGERRWQAWLDYVKYRKIYNQIGAKSLYVYAQKDLLKTLESRVAKDVTVKGQMRAQLAAQWGGPGVFAGPKGVALSPDGKNLYVLDSASAQVKVLDGASSQVIKTFGGPESGQGQLNPDFGGPCGGIDVGPNGNIYVTDSWHKGADGRIVAYDANGNYLQDWKPFYGPRGLTVDDKGNIYVCDTGNNRIVVIEALPSGKILREFGSFGVMPGEFSEPVGITFAPPDQLYICDVGNRRIQVLDTNGRFRREIRVPGWLPDEDADGKKKIPVGLDPYIAVRNDGAILVSDANLGVLYYFDASGNEIYSLAQKIVMQPKGLTFGPDGTLYVADVGPGQNRVKALSIQR